MGTVYRSPEHPADADLLERLLAREVDPHVAACARCAERAETIARAIDPLRDGSVREPFDELFYRRQAARIHTRIAAGEGRRPSLLSLFRLGLPRLAWVGAAAAALGTMAIALHGRAPVEQDRGPARPVTVAAVNGFPSAQDLAYDRLLREIDDTLDEDPYAFDPVGG